MLRDLLHACELAHHEGTADGAASLLGSLSSVVGAAGRAGGCKASPADQRTPGGGVVREAHTERTV